MKRGNPKPDWVDPPAWVYSPKGVLREIGRIFDVDWPFVESALEQHFDCKLPRHENLEDRLDAIRQQFNPGEANDLVSHISKLVHG